MQRLLFKKSISAFVPLVLLVTLMQAIPVVFPKLNLNSASGAVVNGGGANDLSLRIQFRATFGSGTYPTLGLYLKGNTNLKAEWLNVTNPTSYTTYNIPDTAANSGGYTTWTCSSPCPASGDVIELKISSISDGSGDLVGIGTNVTDTYSQSLYDVVSFGNFPSFQYLQYAFKSTPTQFQVTAQIPTTVTSLSYAFWGSFANPDLSGWNTASITDMSNMFNTAQYFNQNIGSWNTSAVTNMASMFTYANIFNQNIGSWNTSAVTNMSRMFQSASSFNQNIGGWNTSAVTDMSNMFNAAGSFNQNIGSWNTGAVTNMASMFNSAGSFNQNVSGWNTGAVTSMSSMFNSAGSFNNGQGSGVSGGADLTFSTENVTLFTSMFYGATVFNQKVSSFDTSKATTFQSMFNRARAFNNGQAPGGAGSNPILWNTSNVTTIKDMFLNTQASVFNQNVSGWNLSKCTDLSGVFVFNAAFNNGAADGQSNTLTWVLNTTANVTLYQLFQNASKFNADISGWNTSRVTRMDNLFYGATSFNQNIGSWNTGLVSTFSSMFNGATSFNQNIGSWNTGLATSMTFMFNGATSFNQNIGSWDTRSLLNISSMFQGASVFNQDISGWNTTSVSNMSNTFNGATAFNQDLSSFQLSSVGGSPFIGIFGSSGSSGMSSDNLERTTTSWSHQSARTGFPTGGTYDAFGKPRWVNCVGYFAYLRLNAKIPMTTWGTLGATPSGCTTATISWYGAATTQTVANSTTSFTPVSASSTSGVSPRYVVINRGNTVCRVNNSTGQINYTTAGTCTIRAYDVSPTTNGDASTFKDVAFTLPTPTTATQLSTPSAPTASATTGSTTSINVSFTAVSNASSYTARVYLAADGTTLVGSAITSFTSGSAITGLSVNTAYKVTITAIGNGTAYLDSAASSLSSTVTTNSLPTINSFASSNVSTPSSAVFGSTVTITGTNFSNATAVKQGTTSASSFTVVNSTTITFTVNAASGAAYAISVTTAGGTATSITNLTVTPEVPTISTQPSSATRGVGTSVTFSVAINSLSETGTLVSYQWKKDSNDISGATNASYTIESSTVADAGSYSVTITNTSSSSTSLTFLNSNAATLTMNTAGTTTSFTTSSASPAFGTAVTLTASVTAGATGVVAFKDSSNNTLCTTGNLSSGSANCSWTPSSVGDFVVSAVYEGDVNYSTSTSSTITVSVGKANQSPLSITSLGTSSKSYPFSQALNASTSGGSGGGNVSYIIESGGTATSCTLSSSASTATLTANSAGTCFIKATKAGGTNYNDTTSATATFTFSDVAPGAPTISAITAGFGSLSIAFTAGTNNGTALTNYAYSTDGGATFKNLATPGITSPIVITTVSGSSSSLVAGTTYAIKIRAINTLNGADSSAVNGTPRTATVPGVATGVITAASATSLSITIDWSADSNGSPITKWWLNYGYKTPSTNYTWSFSIVDAASDGTYTQSFTMLPGYDYEFTAEAENSIGRHPYFFGPRVYGAPLSVTYDGQSNTSGSVPVDNTIYVRSGSAVVLGNTGTLARTGYTWAGWTVNSNGGGTVYSGGETYTLGTTNLILYAKWNPNTLTVTYNSNSGTSVTAGSVLTGGALSAPTAPTRTGYDFAGWSATDGGSVLTFPYSPPNTGSFTLYAKWTAKTLVVSYDTQGGSSITSGSATTGSSISISPGTPTRSGYSFNGWFAGSTGGSALTFPYAHSQTADFTVYAQWSAVTYTVTYAKNGATGNLATASEAFTTGESAITLPGRGTLVKAGHTFAGWSIGGNTPVLSGGYTTTSNVTLSAVWSPISYTITYVPNGGSSTPTQSSLTIGQTFSLANALTRASSGGVSYQFAGWDSGSTIFQAAESITVGTSDLTFTAVWAQLFEVTYINNGGTFTGSDTKFDAECQTSNLCTDTQAITLNANPTRAGYEFAGWEDQSGTLVTDANAGTAGIQTTVTATRFIFSANWTAVSYTVTYVSSGSAAPTQGSLTIGQSFIIGSAVTRTGYTFDGYSDGTNIFLPGATYVVGSANITLTALWIADVYTVSYDWNGSTGTATASSTYTVGTSSDISFPVVGNQVRTNYSFDGWALSRNGTKLSGSTFIPTASVTLFARWTINVFTVTYSVQGGTGIPGSATTDAGGSVTLPRPTRNHYVFLGWYDASTGGSLVSLADVLYTPSASVTLYARWRQSSLTGFTDAQLTRVFSTAKASSSEDRTFSFNTTGGYGMSVFVPKEALPNNTELGFYLAASPSATAKNAISGTINYVLSVVIAWTDPTGDVPDTPPGSPILVTITDSKIKAGAIVYSQLAGRVVELGRATQNGSVTVSITSDPEIFVVQSKPTVPTGVSATDSISGVSTVTWSAPSDMGGSDLIFYTVMTSGVQVCRTSQTSCSASGLNDTTRYSFTVTATNSVGTSDASSSSNLINSPTAPTPPQPSSSGATNQNVSSEPDLVVDLKLQEVTKVQSTDALLAVTLKWPGKAFKVKFCISKVTTKCQFTEVVSINSLEGQILNADGELYISTLISGLSPRSEYQAFASLVSENVRGNSDIRTIKTPSGIAVKISGSTTLTLGEQLLVNLDVSGIGTLVSARATGLPRGVGIKKSTTRAEVFGKPRKIGVYFATITITDSFRQVTALPLTVIVNETNATAFVSGAIYKPVSSTSTEFSWRINTPVAVTEVKLGSTIICSTSSTSCRVPRLFGPKSELQIFTTSSSGIVSNPVLPTYVAPEKLVEVGTANFALNSTTLTTVQKSSLKRIAAEMESKGFTQLSVYGYSDKTGSKALNDKLSLARANAVYRYLKILLADKILSVRLIGKGFSDPVASNLTPQGREANRRAVVFVG